MKDSLKRNRKQPATQQPAAAKPWYMPDQQLAATKKEPEAKAPPSALNATVVAELARLSGKRK